MRIYYTGAQSSGKTTLARYTSERLHLPLLTEVARMILAERELQIDALRANIALVNSYQKEVFFRQLLEEKKYTDFVSDRGFDCLAYAARHSTVLAELLESKECQEYISQLKQSKDIKIFFVRPSQATLKNDGVREQLVWDEIIAVDASIKFMLEMFNLKYIQIHSDSMQERVRLIENILL